MDDILSAGNLYKKQLNLHKERDSGVKLVR